MLHQDLIRHIVSAAIELHRYSGRGLCQEMYQHSLGHEFHLGELLFEASVLIESTTALAGNSKW